MKNFRCLCVVLSVLLFLSIGCLDSKPRGQEGSYKIVGWRVVGGTLEKDTNITKDHDIIDEQITVDANGNYVWEYRYRDDETNKKYVFNGVLPEEIHSDLWDLINRYYKMGKKAALTVQRQKDGMLVLRCDLFVSSYLQGPQVLGELMVFLDRTHKVHTQKANSNE